MLKIKKDVDLRELAFYGFTTHYIMQPKIDTNGNIVKLPRLKKDGTFTKKLYTQYEPSKEIECIITNRWDTGKTRYYWEYNYEETNIRVTSETREIEVTYDTNMVGPRKIEIDVIYDLIRSGLVEKVEDLYDR